MPADPATQFQPAGLNIGYQYTPVETRLNPVMQLQAADWAGVGKTALAAAGQLQSSVEMLQKSPVNPAVKAQMLAQQRSAQEGVKQFDYLNQQRAGRSVIAIDAQGNAVTMAPASIQDPNLATLFYPPDFPPKPERQPKKETTTEETPTPKTVTEQPAEGYSASAAVRGAAPAAPSAKPKTGAAPINPGDLLTPSQNQTNAAIQEALQRNRIVSSEQGIPAGYQPPQQAQPSSIWSPQRPSPMAPPAPAEAPPEAQPPVPQTDPAALQQWQSTTQTEPMTAGDAMNWMKRKTTLAQDATYLPHGGPPGADGQPEPAYAFHMKGGGINTVPISQMVKDGGGPIVAAQNTSAVLSQADKLQQPPQVAQAQPQQPSQVWSPQQPSPGPTAAPAAPTGPLLASTAYDPMAYRQGIAQAPGVLTAQAAPQAGVRSTETTGPEIPTVSEEELQAHLAPKPQGDQKVDTPAGHWAGFDWRYNKDGQLYAFQPSDTSTLKELRWYRGQKTWRDSVMDETEFRQSLRDIAKQVPGSVMSIQDEDTRTMPIERVKELITAGKLYLATQGGNVMDSATQSIIGSINQSQSLGRQMDMNRAAKDAGIDISQFNIGAQSSSDESAKLTQSLPPAGEEYPSYKLPLPAFPVGPYVNEYGGPSASWDLGWAALHGSRTARTGGQISPLADKAAAEGQYFQSQLEQTLGVKYNADGTPERSTIPLSAGYQGVGASTRVPLPKDISTIQQVNRAYQSRNTDEAWAGLKEVKDRIDTELRNKIDIARRMNYRVPPEFEDAYNALKNKQNIPDLTNSFRTTDGTLRMPPELVPPKKVTQTEDTAGTQVEDEMRRFYGNRPRPQPVEFNNREERDKFVKDPKNSGRDFMWNGQPYRVD